MGKRAYWRMKNRFCGRVGRMQGGTLYFLPARISPQQGLSPVPSMPGRYLEAC